MEKQGWWTELMYRVVLGASYLLSLLPFRALYFLSDILYLATYYCIRYRRGVVRDNLTKSFPEKPLDEIVRTERAFYRFFCDCFVETLKLVSIPKEEMRRRMVFHGVDGVERAVSEEGRDFIVLYLGHYCNWEWVASLPYSLSLPIRCGQVYHPLYNKVMDKFFLRLRNSFGGESIPMKNVLRRVMELKREGQPAMIGFICDQLPKWNSIHFFVPFLHRETAVFTGTERIGKRVDAAYFFIDVARPRRGYYECTLRRMNPPETGGTDYDMTVMFMQMLEQKIREAPQYWLWTHRRWKRTKEEWLQRRRHPMAG